MAATPCEQTSYTQICLSYMIETAYKPTGITQLPKDPSPARPRWKKPSTAVFAILFGVLLFCILPERIFDLLHVGGQECSKPDVITGFIHLKNKPIIWTAEGFSSDSTNSIGFVDGEHQLVKPSGVYRIAILGDSLVEGLQVPQKKRFSNLLEQQLNANRTLSVGAPVKFEVMNFGTSAASTGQEYLTFLRYVEQFKPDLTILFYDDGDEDKNLRKPLFAEWHPHVVFGLRNGALTASWCDFDSWLHSAQAMPVVLFERFRSSSHQWETLLSAFNRLKTNPAFKDFCLLLDKIHLLNAIEDALTAIFPVNKFGPDDFRKPQTEINAERQSFCSAHGIIFNESPTKAMSRFNEHDFEYGTDLIYHTHILSSEQFEFIHEQESSRWDVTLAILEQMSKECDRVGSKFAVLGFPALKSKEGFAYSFKRITDRIPNGQKAYASDLTPMFDNACRSRKESPRFECHLSEAGHEVLTKVLSDYLVRNQIITR